MKEVKQSRRRSATLRLLRETGGFHLLFFALVTSVTEGLSKAFLSLNGGRMLDSFLARDRESAVTSLALVIAFMLIVAVSIILKDSLLGSYQEKGMVRLRLRTIKALSASRMDWLEGRHSGELSARVSGDLNALAGALRPVLIMGISFTLVQVIAAVFLFTLHGRLTLLIFALVPVTAFLQWLGSSPIKKYRNANRDAMGRLSSVVYDCAGSMETVKSLSLEREIERRFAAAQELQQNAQLREQKIVAALSPISVLGRYLPLMILVLAGGYFVVDGSLTVGQLMVFMALSSSALQVFDNLTGLVASIRQLGVNAGRIVALWDIPAERQGGRSNRDTGADGIALERVSFAYGGGETVLDEVSFAVQPGELVALLGESGSGKSTALKLCASLYDPQSGTVRVGGLPVEQWDLDGLREHIAYVSQDTWLFSGTLEENIICGKPGSKEKLERCLIASGLSDFVQNLREGLQTQVGERGVFLSGGQRQRIAIARAVYKEAGILLLDEATSALDRSTEALVLDGLTSLPEKPAILMITHHLANAQRAGRIVVLKAGVVAEVGSHRQLQTLNGEYARLLAARHGEVLF